MSNGGVSPLCVFMGPRSSLWKHLAQWWANKCLPKVYKQHLLMRCLIFWWSWRARRNVFILCRARSRTHIHTHRHTHSSGYIPLSPDRFSPCRKAHARTLASQLARRFCESYRIWRPAASLLFEWSGAPADKRARARSDGLSPEVGIFLGKISLELINAEMWKFKEQ